MNKKQLNEALAPFPDEMDVFVRSTNGEFYYGLVQSVSKKAVKFSESEDEENEESDCYDDCIIIEVGCTKTTILHSAEYYEGEKYTLTAELIWRLSRSMQFVPLFKPQEGEQFLKDLEEAVRSTIWSSLRYTGVSGDCYVFISTAVKQFSVAIRFEDISKLIVRGETDVINIDSAAYTDKLRELEYYV